MKNETELLQECKLQLEYLNEKFGETGTTNSLLKKLDIVLSQPDVIKSVCEHMVDDLIFKNDNRAECSCGAEWHY